MLSYFFITFIFFIISAYPTSPDILTVQYFDLTLVLYATAQLTPLYHMTVCFQHWLPSMPFFPFSYQHQTDHILLKRAHVGQTNAMGVSHATLHKQCQAF